MSGQIDFEKTGDMVRVDAGGMHYRDLNATLRGMMEGGTRRIEITDVCGQRYIGTNLHGPLTIDIYGTPGNDLGAFMTGPRIAVYGNAQDGCGNTMDEGEIVIHGHAGDVVGLSARGGKVFVRDDVGYRAGIHMKEYGGKRPVIVIGGTAQDFLGEYMAGGVILLLGLTLGHSRVHCCDFVGTGMHGGAIYIRGDIDEGRLGKEVGVSQLDAADMVLVRSLVEEYAAHFGHDEEGLLQGSFLKLYPRWLRPYGKIYAY